MQNEVLLAIGIIAVIVGIFITLREGKQESQNSLDNIEEIHKDILYSIQNTLNESLNKIDKKTEQSLTKLMLEISTLQNSPNQDINAIEKKSKLLSKHQDIYNLYKSGLEPREIAIKLNRGVGEVETIISLLKIERDS